jgi:hypothetical protein
MSLNRENRPIFSTTEALGSMRRGLVLSKNQSDTLLDDARVIGGSLDPGHIPDGE